MIEPKAEFTMNLVKTYTVEGMELLEAVEVKRGWILVAGTMKEALCVCWKKMMNNWVCVSVIVVDIVLLSRLKAT